MVEGDLVHLFQRYLRSQGLNITDARERIAREVSRVSGHFDAQELWRKLPDRPVAPATVYRTLELLVSAGLVRKLRLADRARYEVAVGRPHHEHLVCTGCGRVTEFSDPGLEERLAELVEAHRFRQESHQVTVWGLCPACQEKSRTPGILREQAAR